MVKSRKIKVENPELNVKTPSLTCIGSICFQADGTIKVVVPKGADPRCAKRTADAILGGKQVEFEIEL